MNNLEDESNYKFYQEVVEVSRKFRTLAYSSATQELLNHVLGMIKDIPSRDENQNGVT